MHRRDPFDVLGVAPGSNPATIKAAWRRLARAHHPDVAGARPDAARAATRTMAEINAAYETLRDPVQRRTAETQRARRGPAGQAPPRPGPDRTEGRAASGGADPGAPHPGSGRSGDSFATRPVTGRVDTSSAFHSRNTVTTPPGARRGAHPGGQEPIRVRALDAEPPRASDPTGPLERLRARQAARRRLPPLEVARAVSLEFGKFRGHTLGEVEGFEPSYIDWIARTITRDPDLVAAARSIQVRLDRDGVRRGPRPTADDASAAREPVAPRARSASG